MSIIGQDRPFAENPTIKRANYVLKNHMTIPKKVKKTYAGRSSKVLVPERNNFVDRAAEITGSPHNYQDDRFAQGSALKYITSYQRDAMRQNIATKTPKPNLFLNQGL